MTSRTALVLVRHATPIVDEQTPSRYWGLSEEGHRDAEALAARLDLSAGTAVLSSDEIKARETAEAFADVFVLDRRLREVTRPWVDGDHQGVARRWLAGEEIAGWESRPAVVTRMTEAVDEAIGRGGSTLCVISHGLSITVFVSALTDVDPVVFWSNLEFPDCFRLDYTT